MRFEKSLRTVEKPLAVRILLLTLLLFFVASSTAQAQSSDPPSDDEVNAIARDLYCPVCENTPLDVCPTVACAQWRDMIREKLVAGWSKDEISQYFVDQYGDRVLAEPPRRGFNWLVYVLPPIFFIGGVFLVIINLRKIKMNKPETAAETIDQSDPYFQEVEKALEYLNEKDQGKKVG
jgi:cytochrome c-type biogenesis protein CcmH